MAENLIQFSWYVSKAGYSLNRDRLIDMPDREGHWHSREYLPLDVPDLYRKFAALPVENEEAILSFVHQYGLPVREVNLNASGPFCPLELFRSEAQAMRRAVELFENAKGLLDPAVADLRKRQNFQKVEQNLANLKVLEPQGDALITLSHDPRPVDLAYAEILRITNQRLQKRVAPRLGYALENQWIGSVHLSVVPKDLLGAMWLQLAQMVDGNQLHLRCMMCGTWFLERPQAGKRPAKNYCSDACKQKAHRRRNISP